MLSYLCAIKIRSYALTLIVNLPTARGFVTDRLWPDFHIETSELLLCHICTSILFCMLHNRNVEFFLQSDFSSV